jgi:hypothetical protein
MPGVISFFAAPLLASLSVIRIRGGRHCRNIEAKREIEELMTTLARIEIDKLDKIMAALKV